MPGLLTGPASDSFQSYFIPAVCALILFLGYTSQWLLNTAEYLEPGPLTQRETAIFNILLACVWWTYYKACVVPPGRYIFPPPEDKKSSGDDNAQDASSTHEPPPTVPTTTTNTTARWCKKCAAPKPLRAHHCKHCKTCIPKMDHHCPWTANCVSLQTFPYFLRFLVYTNLALAYLLSWLLYPRLRALFWGDNARLPAYLGPSVPAMVHLVLLALLGGLTALALGILLATTTRGWVLNQTMIEGWEAERHEAVLLRHKKGGWWSHDDYDDDGDGYGRGRPPRVPIRRVEFPYDLGFFDNMAQAMGTRNVLSWFDPFVGGGPLVDNREAGKGTGWEWEENGFNDREGMWPPPDPDKMRRAVTSHNRWPGSAAARAREEEEAELVDRRWANPRDEIAAFRARQEMDLRRRTGRSGVIAELGEHQDLADLEEEDEYEHVDRDSAYGSYNNNRNNYNNNYSNDDDEEEEEEEDEDEDEEEDDEEEDEGTTIPPVRGRPYFEHGADGEPGWTNSEGDRLRDYGVDEDAEDEDEDVPLGELLRRRRREQGGLGGSSRKDR